jgi:hypothetical protein
VLRASLITTYTSRIARQHGTFTQALLSTPCRPLYISGGQQAAYWASQHWVSHQTCRIYQVRHGMPTSCAPGSHLPGTRFMPACRLRKHTCALSPTRGRSIIAVTQRQGTRRTLPHYTVVTMCGDKIHLASAGAVFVVELCHQRYLLTSVKVGKCSMY